MAKINTLNYQTVASWNGSKDLFVVEQPDGTKVATPAMVKQYVLGNSIDDIYSVMGQNGAKNLIPYPYTNAYRTTNGVTITEGSITGSCVFNGTSTGRADAQLGYQNSNALTLLPSVQYCLSIKTDGSFNGNLSVEAWNKETKTYAKNIARATPSSTGSDYKEVKFSVTQSDIDNNDIAVVIYGNSGNTYNNVTVYPMLRLASDTDVTYQPFAMTNRQLTEEKAKIMVKEINVKLSTSGHSAPIKSAAGLYYEALVNYTTLGVTKDKILSVEIINWDSITHSFNLYLGSNTISAMSDSANSIYYGSSSFVDLRVVYRG